MMQVFVSAEIASYEYDCTGRSRKDEALTEEFKATAESRLPRPRVVRVERDPVDWKPGGIGKPSTAARFAGEDFPRGAQFPR